MMDTLSRMLAPYNYPTEETGYTTDTPAQLENWSKGPTFYILTPLQKLSVHRNDCRMAMQRAQSMRAYARYIHEAATDRPG